MIGVRQESELIERVVKGLLHQEHPVSYNLVVPPGFGEDQLAEALAAKLKIRPEKPLVAILSADQIRNADSYASELFAQWNACGAGLPSAPANTTLNRITQFFDLIPPGRPAIQILTRFHRILDVFDASFLGDLRDRERASLVRSVCVSPHGYDRRIPGDTLACQAALPLLEQVFRAWAFVSMGLNYYAARRVFESMTSGGV